MKSYRTGEAMFRQGDIMDAIYIVTKGSVRLDVSASSDAFSFIRNILRQQFGNMGTDDLYAMFSATSLDSAASSLIKRFVPVTQLTQHREVHPPLYFITTYQPCFSIFVSGSIDAIGSCRRVTKQPLRPLSINHVLLQVCHHRHQNAWRHLHCAPSVR